MLTIGEIWNWISVYQQNIQECERQIARLQPVKRQLGSIKGQFQSARKSTENIFEEKGKWAGEKYTAFCRAGAALDDACGEYYRRLDAAQDAVNTKIHELEAKKAEMLPLISDLFSMLHEAQAKAENALNG